MTDTTMRGAIEAKLEGRLLLDHPFYRRWEAGELGEGELAAYASQYRHFEAMLPGFLRSVGAAIDEGPQRDLVFSNLDDELSNPRPHLELLEDFARSVDAAPAGASPATSDLIGTYAAALAEGPAAALGALAAYEIQSSDIASSKAAGLRRHYGVDDAGVQFWDVHAEVDREHADWVLTALDGTSGDRTTILSWIRAAADAWWAFLDEREAERPVAA